MAKSFRRFDEDDYGYDADESINRKEREMQKRRDQRRNKTKARYESIEEQFSARSDA